MLACFFAAEAFEVERADVGLWSGSMTGRDPGSLKMGVSVFSLIFLTIRWCFLDVGLEVS